MTAPNIALVASPRASFDDAYTELAGALAGAGAVVRVDGAASPLVGSAVEPLPVAPGNAAADAACALALIARWSERPPDLVHALDSDALGAARIAARAVGVPRLVATLDATFDGATRRGPRWTRRLAYRRARAAHRAADRFVALSAGAADAWVALGVDRSKVTLLDSGMGIPFDAFFEGPTAERRRNESRAALDLSAEALVVAGVGPEESVRRVVAGAGLDGVVTLHVPGAEEGRRRAVAASDVLISCASDAGHALAVKEAMASGIPVIATRVTGHSEVVRHRDCGVLYRDGDLDAAATGLKALGDPKVRAVAGDRARALAGRLFDRDLAVRKLVALYDAVLSGEAAAPARLTADGRVVEGRDLVGD